MVQIIPKASSFGEEFARAFGAGSSRGLIEGLDERAKKKMMARELAQENEAIKKAHGIDLSGIIDPKARQDAFGSHLKSQNDNQLLSKRYDLAAKNQIDLENMRQGNKKELLGNKQEFLNQILGSRQSSGGGDDSASEEQKMSNFDVSKISDEDIARATAVDPNLGRSLAHLKDVNLRENRSNEEFKNKKFESERAYHTQFSKPLRETVEGLRESIPRMEMSLNFARSAIESGDVGQFSLANLGQRLGFKELQTAKGAQLVTAAKENLLGNITRVSARAQNQWFEQRINSMMAQVGQSEEANLASQEMLEAELALGKAYINEFDRLSEEDIKNFGFERNDIAKRARAGSKPIENQILDRASYRSKEIEENEMGLTKMKKKVGKNVIQGEPLTLAMARLYKEKFGDNALNVAEKNGYKIPTLEEFKAYQQRPKDFREDLVE